MVGTNCIGRMRFGRMRFAPTARIVALLVWASLIPFVSPVPPAGAADPMDIRPARIVDGRPAIRIDLDGAGAPGRSAVVLEIFLLLTVLSLAPGILVMVTAFTRIVVVLSILRQALGTQGTPPNPVIVGLSLFLTLFIMFPVGERIYGEAIRPYLNEEISMAEAMGRGEGPLREFLAAQTRERDIALFVEIAGMDRPRNIDDVPTRILVPAFVISELKTAFQIGFLLYLPFLIVDMVVASVLLSMGMMMLPPVMISLPFKLMLFVLADGWYLIVGSLARSF
jgi:flagellar biosynthesis protein FliP